MSELIVPGDVVYDAITGTRVTIIELRADGFVVDQVIEPNHTPSVLNHLHKTWTEKFEIISGVGRYSLDNQEYDGTPGHTFMVKPGQAHIHPWNTGSEELHFKQSDVFDPPDPTAAVDTFLAFSTMFGMALDGRGRKDGTAKNPFHMMVQLDFFRQHGGYIVGTPAVMQDVLLGGGSALGRAMGFRAWYEEYLPKNVKR